MRDDSIHDEEVLASLLRMAVEATEAPATRIKAYFYNEGLSVEKKLDGSPVTVADREAEHVIREVLGRDSIIGPVDILGEEYGLQGKGTRFRWTIDPIDGTRSFVRGIPLFGTIVALEDTVERRAIVGVIHFPVLNMTYSAARGLGSWCNGQRIHASSRSSLDEAMISVGDPLQFAHAKFEVGYRRLAELCTCLRGYTDCFGHGLVVSGAIDVMIDPDLNPWDVLATQVLVEEAGGTMLMRPSANANKVDAVFGSSDLVKLLAVELKRLGNC